MTDLTFDILRSAVTLAKTEQIKRLALCAGSRKKNPLKILS